MTILNLNKATNAKKPLGFFAKYNQAAKYRRAENELNKLSDRLLADMGMSRGAVHGKVWGEF